MHLPFFWRWLRWWCEPVVCLLPLGVPRPGLGSPSTRLSLSRYVDRSVARHAWLAAPVHVSLEGPRMGPGSFLLYLGFLLTTCGTSIGGYGKYILSLVPPRCSACSCIVGALFVTLCGTRLWPPLGVFLHFAQPLVGCGVDFMGLAPLPCWPMLSDPGPLARFLPICRGVHRSPFAHVCVYVVIAWLSFGSLLCIRPAPSADP
ncbi:hypothetical protein V6N13_109474 [Hibiscus sabdariffa]|uniref:Uncharacterized protein n=1 Tax=Hibiscus sabdariffa TaxID=183260 RepID=A0ABR2FPR1_9ROSI